MNAMDEIPYEPNAYYILTEDTLTLKGFLL